MTPPPRDEGSGPPSIIDPRTLERLRGGLRIHALRRLRDADAAEEAVQEILARTLRLVREGRVPRPEELAPIAHGVARHVLADELRRRIRSSRLASLLPWLPRAQSAPDALASLVMAEEQERLRRAWAQLAPEDREILRLSFYEEVPSAELARRAGEPAERLRKRKSRALARLRRAFFGEGGTEPGDGRVASDGHARAANPMKRVATDASGEDLE